ncbi:MAG: AAA family ATPase, partial [bacterium]|nr:AAA family ATPase [bacterium]
TRYTALSRGLGDVYKRQQSYDEKSGTSEKPLMDLFGEISSVLEKIEEKEDTLAEIQELTLFDMRSKTIVSHRDVGIGVSQVLPVLVSSYAMQNQIIAIEQPEIHLHPALQADLGDVFIESALGSNRNRFLLETHSEHLLLRIMRRIRETSAGKLPEGLIPVSPSDVMVLFVEPNDRGSIIHEMPLNERGELIKPWPGGFFEEDFQELF